MTIAEQIAIEAIGSYLIYGRYCSAHEAYGVILEEVAELFDEVRKQKRDIPAMIQECIQIAACAQRFAEQLQQEGTIR